MFLSVAVQNYDFNVIFFFLIYLWSKRLCAIDVKIALHTLCANSSVPNLLYGDSIVTFFSKSKRKQASRDKHKRTSCCPGGFGNSQDINL